MKTKLNKLIEKVRELRDQAHDDELTSELDDALIHLEEASDRLIAMEEADYDELTQEETDAD